MSGVTTTDPSAGVSRARAAPGANPSLDQAGPSFSALVRAGDGAERGPARFDQTGVLSARASTAGNAKSVIAVSSSGATRFSPHIPGAAPSTTMRAPSRGPAVSRAALSSTTRTHTAPEVQDTRANAPRTDAVDFIRTRKSSVARSALPARAPIQKPHACAQASSIFVALHPTQTSCVVFARPGRMAPTEQAKLRNAIAALLAEFGYHDGAIEISETAGEASWRK